MILSISRRTDIPAYYLEWLVNRFNEGYVCVRNPINYHQVSKIIINPDVIDGLVFWTKNPIHILNKLSTFKEYTYYFQITINSYQNDIESNIPSKLETIIPAVIQLSNSIGSNKIIWRYDPIFYTNKYTYEYHVQNFERIASLLSTYTNTCVISFLDMYKKIENKLLSNNIHILQDNEKMQLVKSLSEIAQKYNIAIKTCAENINLIQYGIEPGSCIDKKLFESLLNCKLSINKDKNQRECCNCVASIDIGAYNTCFGNCLYCYANISSDNRNTNHDPNSPLLIGNIENNDKVSIRKIISYKEKC